MLVERNSWHYKWLAYTSVMGQYTINMKQFNELRSRGLSYVDIYEYDKYMFKRPTNFCQYWRAVLITPIASVVINTLFLGALASLAFMFPSGVAFGAGVIIAALALIFLIALVAGGMDLFQKKVESLKSDPKSFVGNAYNGYKNNVCTLMEYKNEEGK